MPYRADERRHPHLEFVRETINVERRKQRGRSRPRLDRGDRAVFGQQLSEAVDRIENEQRRKPRPFPGVNPRLVFRVPFVDKPQYEKIVDLFDRAGMSVVSVEPDGAVVVFREAVRLAEFRRQIGRYQAGPRQRSDGTYYASSDYDILEYINPDEMRSWGRSDRVGPRLIAVAGAQGELIDDGVLYVVELELWHPGTQAAAQQIVRELRAAFQRDATGNERWFDQYVGPGLALAKMRVSGAHLNNLLDLEVVATIDLPLVGQFDVHQARQSSERSFPPPPPPPVDGPRLCIVDSGIISNHPLLRPYVGHEEAVLTTDSSPADMNGHGTRVAALAVYGDVRGCYERGLFESTITLYSARVLNEHNGFDDERLIINQLRAAVEAFAREPYNCRIFNVSIGGHEPGLSSTQRRQNWYGEALDIIAREYQVLFVVSAGNHTEITSADNIDEVLTTYPAALLSPAARLCDFATTAIGLTVGALAEHESLGIRRGMDANDIVRAVARPNEPSPITRSGPGMEEAIKPDLVHYGGNLVFDRGRGYRPVQDPGAAVMTFSHEPLNQLFAYDTGTSYAAPRVARLAALVEYQLSQQLGIMAHPNLVRAVLAASAHIPPEARNALERTGDPHAHVKVCGYGLPDDERALGSADSRAVLLAQAAIALDHLHIYRVPVPDCLLQAPGLRSITVALAFDPPVRARRLDYLGVRMGFQLIRGKTLDDVYESYRRVQRGEEADEAIGAPYALTFEPKSYTRGVGGYSRKRSTLQCGTHFMRGSLRKFYGNDYWLVVRAERRWAGEELSEQPYAVVVALQAESPELYAQVRQRIQQRVRVRV